MTEIAAERMARITVNGEYASLDFERFLPHPQVEVWNAITEAKALESWYQTSVMIKPGPGGAVEFGSESTPLHVTGKITEWDPPNVLAHEWILPPSTQLPDGEHTLVRWKLTPVHGGTMLRLSHRNFARRVVEGLIPGLDPAPALHMLLDRLACYLDAREMPDTLEAMKLLRAAYHK